MQNLYNPTGLDSKEKDLGRMNWREGLGEMEGAKGYWRKIDNRMGLFMHTFLLPFSTLLDRYSSAQGIGRDGQKALVA